MNTLHQRNLEVAELSRINLELKQVNGAREVENEDLREQILAVERKNKTLSDKINEIIYNKASTYKERTLDALRKNAE